MPVATSIRATLKLIDWKIQLSAMTRQGHRMKERWLTNPTSPFDWAEYKVANILQGGHLHSKDSLQGVEDSFPFWLIIDMTWLFLLIPDEWPTSLQFSDFRSLISVSVMLCYMKRSNLFSEAEKSQLMCVHVNAVGCSLDLSFSIISS